MLIFHGLKLKALIQRLRLDLARLANAFMLAVGKAGVCGKASMDRDLGSFMIDVLVINRCERAKGRAERGHRRQKNAVFKPELLITNN